MLSTETTKSSQTLQIKKLSANAQIPTRGSPYSAGLDLFSAVSTVIPANGKGLVATDLSIALPSILFDL